MSYGKVIMLSVRAGASGALLDKACRSWSPEKLRSPFFLESIAKLTDAIACTQSKALRVTMASEQPTLRRALPASWSIDQDVEVSATFEQSLRSHS